MGYHTMEPRSIHGSAPFFFHPSSDSFQHISSSSSVGVSRGQPLSPTSYVHRPRGEYPLGTRQHTVDRHLNVLRSLPTHAPKPTTVPMSSGSKALPYEIRSCGSLTSGQHKEGGASSQPTECRISDLIGLNSHPSCSQAHFTAPPNRMRISLPPIVGSSFDDLPRALGLLQSDRQAGASYQPRFAQPLPPISTSAVERDRPSPYHRIDEAQYSIPPLQTQSYMRVPFEPARNCSLPEISPSNNVEDVPQGTVSLSVHRVPHKSFCPQGGERIQAVGSLDHHEAARQSQNATFPHQSGQLETSILPQLTGLPQAPYRPTPDMYPKTSTGIQRCDHGQASKKLTPNGPPGTIGVPQSRFLSKITSPTVVPGQASDQYGSFSRDQNSILNHNADASVKPKQPQAGSGSQSSPDASTAVHHPSFGLSSNVRLCSSSVLGVGSARTAEQQVSNCSPGPSNVFQSLNPPSHRRIDNEILPSASQHVPEPYDSGKGRPVKSKKRPKTNAVMAELFGRPPGVSPAILEALETMKAKPPTKERNEFIADVTELIECYEQKLNIYYDSVESKCVSLILDSRIPHLEDTITTPIDDETQEDAEQKLIVKKKFVESIEKLQDDQLPTKRRGNLPKESTAYLKKWFEQHYDYPCK